MNKVKIGIIASLSAMGATTIIVPTAIAVSGNNSKVLPIDHRYDKLAAELKQQAVEEFVALSKIYRPSFETRDIADYLKKRIKELRPDLNVIEDKYNAALMPGEHIPAKSSGNLYFDVPANDPALANNDKIAIQGHMDMVCSGATAADVERMKSEGVKVHIDETKQIITSENNKTSLGADDGIGLGLILAMIKNQNFKHGPLKMIITADEEEGMAGAAWLGHESGDDYGGSGQKVLKDCKTLINIDNETEGQIIASTAGAVGGEYIYTGQPTEPITTNAYALTVDGLNGGHSGDFVSQGRANAIDLANRVLSDLSEIPQYISFTTPGTTATNSIPTKSVVWFSSSLAQNKIQESIDKLLPEFKKESFSDPNINIKIEPLPTDIVKKVKCYSKEDSEKIFGLLRLLWYGVFSWKDIGIRLPETSQNIGPITLGYFKDTDEGELVSHEFHIKLYGRSCNNLHLSQMQVYNTGAAIRCFGEPNIYRDTSLYYGWAGDKDQSFIDFVKKSYNNFGVNWTIDNPHAGLEISWFKHYNENMYVTAIGPTLLDVHTINETLYLNTFDSVIKVALASVDNMKK